MKRETRNKEIERQGGSRERNYEIRRLMILLNCYIAKLLHCYIALLFCCFSV